MQNYKIHYLGFGIQYLQEEDILSAMFHLGAKYGARLYNRGLLKGAIKISTEDKTITVDPEMMTAINEEMLHAGEILY